jgi:hypothetical protein
MGDQRITGHPAERMTANQNIPMSDDREISRKLLFLSGLIYGCEVTVILFRKSIEL